MSRLTTHVLDLRLGQPAEGIAVYLEKRDPMGGWHMLASGATNDDGRVANLLEPGTLTRGRHRLTFETGAYFDAQGVEHFFPQITVEFDVADVERSYHVPLLMSPFGYSTYRGS